MKAIANDPRLGLQVLDRVSFFAPQLPPPGSENPDHLRTMAGLEKAMTAQAEHRAVLREVGRIAAERVWDIFNAPEQTSGCDTGQKQRSGGEAAAPPGAGARAKDEAATPNNGGRTRP